MHAVCRTLCSAHAALPHLRTHPHTAQVSQLRPTSQPARSLCGSRELQLSVGKCIARFKFQADPRLARALADLMRHAPWVEPALDAAQRVLPMPLSLSHLRERGFNQALELARHLAPHKTHAHSLLRRDDSARQVEASRHERLEHVRDAFWVAPEHVSALRG